MKRVYQAADILLAGHIHAVLEQHGIPAVLRNAYLGGAAGELPLNECWPEVWVSDDEDYELARRLVADILEAPGGSDWRCSGCGELVEGQFAACWSCGRAAPER
ncbi:hypothetical protein CAI21_20250 [Alkalilimnicola ehrlichii]|uniref:DUF2007 domain-containing protein n=1 Tax=Alkalilimnicola ehrlichii TaxID=351052 RepID=A0A3E0WIT4_9GAMM|nr:DUF2007 domain-containing protein [Alkalilimnicola ehrlichii]RFA24803.1 hypothetical protein CAI21_20250 [Alkalilimnicola ehrlichii]RFA32061.1 hypothetical protein CAL65_20710 [Alkalilimnicola ehrlichii]